MGFLDNVFGGKPDVQTTPDFRYMETRAGLELDPATGDYYINPNNVSPYGEGMLPGVVPPSRIKNRSITVKETLALPAVWRAVSVLTTGISQLELEVRRQGVRVIPTPNLIAHPDADDSLSEWIEDTVVSLALYGNAYWRLYRDLDNRVFNIQVLSPLNVTIEYREDGTKQFVMYDHNQHRIVLRKSDVQHIRLLKIPGEPYGLGPVQHCAGAFLGAKELKAYADKWFDGSNIPNGVLTSNQKISAETAQAIKDRWEVTQSGHGVAVLGQDLTYTPLALNPKEAQFLEVQAFSRTEIAMIFGIPAGLMLAEVNGNAMTYQNIEQGTLEMIRFTLMQYLNKIESALTQITPNGQTVHFNLEGLLRPDSKTRADVQEIYLRNKVKTVDEIRADEGLPALTTKQKNELTPKPVPAVEPSPDGNNGVPPAASTAPAGTVNPTQKVEA